MQANKAAILAQLQKEILPLQGYKKPVGSNDLQVLPAVIGRAFPNGQFPLGAVHEFCCTNPETATASSGFIAAIVATLMKNNGACIWISQQVNIFPPALQHFGIAPDKVIFIDLQKERDILWTMEEALKCEGLSAVIAELKDLSFTASRRLQLLVEQSQVTGLILRNNPRSMNTTACVTRWQIAPFPSLPEDDLPGVGFARWKVVLQKVRNGTPGEWIIEFAGGRLRQVIPAREATIITAQQKTG